MATINIGGIPFEYEPGSTYVTWNGPPGEPEPSQEEKEQSRADSRAQAVKRFQEVAAGQTFGAIEKTVQQLFALLIQMAIKSSLNPAVP